MEHRKGDCKCMAQIAADTIALCDGWNAWVLSLRHGNRYHAVAVFTTDTGDKGYVDSQNYRFFPPFVLWEDIAQDVPGGPWEEIE